MTSVRPKLAPQTPKIVTAWNVLTGRTVYRNANGLWSEDIREAEILSGEAADRTLDIAKGEEQRILDPYLMEVSENGEVSGRETLRETIRARGPTTHPQFGKLAREAEHA